MMYCYYPINLKRMQRMLNYVEIFGKEHEIIFNPSKSNYMVINENKTTHSNGNRNRKFKLNGTEMNKVTSLKYLGNFIMNNLKNTQHINNRIKLAMATTKKIEKVGYLNKFTSTKTKMQLYKSFVRPTLLYGMESLSLKLICIYHY